MENDYYIDVENNPKIAFRIYSGTIQKNDRPITEYSMLLGQKGGRKYFI